MDAIRSKTMHDEDNELRLTGCNKKGETFKLIGEDDERHDFARPENLESDEDMKNLLDRAVAAAAASVQQVCDVALGRQTVDKKDYSDISDRIPRVEVFWKELGEERSRTHSLEFRPEGVGEDTPKPIYKFHANFDEGESVFKDPIVAKRTEEGSWRKVLLGDVDNFAPGVDLAYWLPRTPGERTVFPG